MFGQKKFWSEEMFGRKKYLYNNIIVDENHKKYLVNTNLGQRILGQKYFWRSCITKVIIAAPGPIIAFNGKAGGG